MSTQKNEDLLMAEGDQVHDDVLSLRELRQRLKLRNMPVVTQEMVEQGDELCDNILTSYKKSDFFRLRNLQKHLQASQRPSGTGSHACQ